MDPSVSTPSPPCRERGVAAVTGLVVAVALGGCGGGAPGGGGDPLDAGADAVDAPSDDAAVDAAEDAGPPEVCVTYGAPALPWPRYGAPAVLAAADLDGDGIVDILTGDEPGMTFPRLRVLHGEGGGRFVPQGPLAGTYAPSVLRVIDLNDDERPDVVFPNGASGGKVLIARSDGTFEEAFAFPPGPPVLSMVVADVNRDGAIDVVTAPTVGALLEVFLGVGDGRFIPFDAVEAFDVPPTTVTNLVMAAGDVDDDGHLDLVVASERSGELVVLRGRSDASFVPGVALPSDDHPTGLAVADINRDGRDDVIVTSPGHDAVTLRVGTSAGTLASPASFAVGQQPLAVAVGDLDRDGWADVVTTNVSDRTVSVLRNNRAGGFAPPATYTTGVQSGASGSDLELHDVTGDGDLDVLVANLSGSVTVLAGTSTGALVRSPSYPTIRQPRGHALADFDGDHQADVAVIGADNSIAVLRGQGAGFRAPVVTPNHPEARFPIAVAQGDLDNDGRPDLVVANLLDRTGESAPSLTVLLGSPAGLVTAARYPLETNPRVILVTDLDGDGDQDVVTGNEFNTTGKVSVLLGDGTGVLGAPGYYGYFALSTNVADLAAGDVDEDGDVDLVTVDAALSLIPGRGDGTFATNDQRDRGFSQQQGTDLFAVELIDRDGDTHLDAFVAGAVGVGLAGYVPGNGDGTFGELVTVTLTTLPTSMVVSDLDRDGDLDLATASATNAIDVVFDVGNGLLARARGEFGTGNDPLLLAALDVDGDGNLDLVTANAGSNDVSVLLMRPCSP